MKSVLLTFSLIAAATFVSAAPSATANMPNLWFPAGSIVDGGIGLDATSSSKGK